MTNDSGPLGTNPTLSVVVPCYNEESTLKRCVERVLAIASDTLSLELIIVDDCSTDGSAAVAGELKQMHPEVRVCTHERNRGKGAALHTGFAEARGQFVAVQDADLEYDPNELVQLLRPLRDGHADVVLGSRFLTAGAHRVLYFWHSLGNHFLTFLSNMLTDLNLTDMETCYKVFRREVLQSLPLREERFGFEPEVVARLAERKVRVYEMGVSYYGRSYGEGKKIGVKDGIRAVYCILRYNLHRAPLALQLPAFQLFSILGVVADVVLFSLLARAGVSVLLASSAGTAAMVLTGIVAAYLMVFKHRARWSSGVEWALLAFSSAAVWGTEAWLSTVGARANPVVMDRLVAASIGHTVLYLCMRYLVFREHSGRIDWSPASQGSNS